MNSAAIKREPGRFKKASESKSQSRTLRFSVDIERLKAYQDAANIGFKGDLAAFLMSAADALASQLALSEVQRKRERAAFLRAAAQALNAHLAAKAKRQEQEAPPSADPDAPGRVPS